MKSYDWMLILLLKDLDKKKEKSDSSFNSSSAIPITLLVINSKLLINI
jgi:hypothetical protein